MSHSQPSFEKAIQDYLCRCQSLLPSVCFCLLHSRRQNSKAFLSRLTPLWDVVILTAGVISPAGLRRQRLGEVVKSTGISARTIQLQGSIRPSLTHLAPIRKSCPVLEGSQIFFRSATVMLLTQLFRVDNDC